jgi:hypothetical protein
MVVEFMEGVMGRLAEEGEKIAEKEKADADEEEEAVGNEKQETGEENGEEEEDKVEQKGEEKGVGKEKWVEDDDEEMGDRSGSTASATPNSPEVARRLGDALLKNHVRNGRLEEGRCRQTRVTLKVHDRCHSFPLKGYAKGHLSSFNGTF